jgi:hypothetical protein
LPSITSSSAFSSPNRYSSGPVITTTVRLPNHPRASISAKAPRTRSISGAKLALRAMNTSRASTATALMSRPSRTA